MFDRCDGELETVSNKSCESEFFGNTFVECAGTLTLRQGNDCLVVGNVFLGAGKKHSGGIRVMGEGHRIENNIIVKTDGRADGAIALSAGNENPKPYEYAAARNIELVGNYLESNKRAAIAFDHNFGSRRRTVLPSEVKISGNRFVGLEKNGVKGELGEEVADWSGNIFGSGKPASERMEPLTPNDVGPDSGR